MSTELTPWFPGKVKPAHEGIYQTDGGVGDSKCFQHWGFEGWGYCSFSAADAQPVSVFGLSSGQAPQWRGLAKKPATKDAEVSNG